MKKYILTLALFFILVPIAQAGDDVIEGELTEFTFKKTGEYIEVIEYAVATQVAIPHTPENLCATWCNNEEVCHKQCLIDGNQFLIH